jgi:hypothetical protein
MPDNGCEIVADLRMALARSAVPVPTNLAELGIETPCLDMLIARNSVFRAPKPGFCT